jgi:hypothetical protein
MATYTKPTISNYNDNPPSNDGSTNFADNGVDWDLHIDEIGDPLNNFTEAVNSETLSGFDKVDLKTSVLIDGTGDGVADDTSAIQAAADTGKTVHLSDGKTYLFTELTLSNDIKFSGDGTLTGGATTGSKPTRSDLTGAANSTARLALLDAYYAATITFTGAGKIRGQVRIDKTVITSSTINEIQIAGNMILDDVSFHTTGISPINGGVVDAAGLIVSDAAATGIFPTKGGVINAPSAIVVSAATRGVYCLYSGTAIIAGAEVWNSGTNEGIAANHYSEIVIDGGHVEGSGTSGGNCWYTSTISYGSATITNNGSVGIVAESNSTAWADGATITDNGSSGVQTHYGAFIQASNATITGNGAYGAYANNSGFIDITGAEVDDTNTGAAGQIIRAIGEGTIKSEAAGGTGKTTLIASNYLPLHNTLGYGKAMIFDAGQDNKTISAPILKHPIGALAIIATGAFTASASYHKVRGEGQNPDQLDTINGGIDGQRLILRAENSVNTITLSQSGNIELPGTSIALDNEEDTVELIYDDDLSKWLVLSFSDNGV